MVFNLQVFHALSLLKWILYPPKYDINQGIDSIVSWSEKARESGYLSLENIAEEEEDFYINKALNLLVDGAEVENLRIALELDLDIYREHNLRSAHVFESMGGYSPTIGIIGAVLGLIQAMAYLDQPDKLGAGIAVAFVATIYGVGFANFIYLPIANKIRLYYQFVALYKEMTLIGLLAISHGENGMLLDRRLSGYIDRASY